MTGGETIHEAGESIELVQLPSGKIVQADSEEGKAFKASQQSEAAAVPETQLPQASGFDMDDKVHQVWADMGLSRRAWSQSPSPPPAARRVQHLR